jgi:hypothetical protein
MGKFLLNPVFSLSPKVGTGNNVLLGAFPTKKEPTIPITGGTMGIFDLHMRLLNGRLLEFFYNGHSTLTVHLHSIPVLLIFQLDIVLCYA